MKKVVVGGFLLLAVVEAYAVVLPDRRMVGWAAGAAVAVLLAALRWFLRDGSDRDAVDSPSDDAAELLRHWLSQTEALVRRAESTRTEWDRHLRPRLAREFAAATGQRQAKDPVAFVATGWLVFGPDLWQWVDPNNVDPSRRDAPGPGRAVFGEILQRLERL